jgi:putative flippase GtrA
VPFSKSASFVCGSIVGYIINKLWTFESKKFSAGEIIRYALLYCSTLLINTGVNQIAIQILNQKLWAFVPATGVSTILNFLGQKFFVFRK